MKIMLVSPPSKRLTIAPPLGLGYLAGVLINAGLDVRLVDAFNLSLVDTMKNIRAFDPDIVGITCNTGIRFESFALAQMIKMWNPNVIIILGGPHVTALPDQVLHNYPQVDYIVRGEGERTIVELVERLSKEKSMNSALGVSYRDEKGNVHHNPERPFIRNLDEIPFPTWHFFNFDSYDPYEDLPKGLNKLRKAPIITTRGCPYKCVFCYSDFWGRLYRSRSAENVVKEIRLLYDKYRVRYIRFFDDSFTINPGRVVKICRLTRGEGLDLVWRCESRVDNVNREMLFEMVKAGCHLIEFGIESGSPLILRNIKKRITVDQIKLAFKRAREAGIQTKAFVMVGNPGETRETVLETLKLLKVIRPDIVVIFKTMVFPNTELYYNMLRDGKITEDVWLEKNIEFPLYTVECSEKILDEFYNLIFFGYCLKYTNKLELLKYGLRILARDPIRFSKHNPVIRGLKEYVRRTIARW